MWYLMCCPLQMRVDNIRLPTQLIPEVNTLKHPRRISSPLDEPTQSRARLIRIHRRAQREPVIGKHLKRITITEDTQPQLLERLPAGIRKPEERKRPRLGVLGNLLIGVRS
jgi:hypothetical protein